MNLQDFVGASRSVKEAMVREVASLGVPLVRTQASWARVEAVRGVYSWGDLDETVGLLEAAGVGFLLDVGTSPSWLRGGNGDTLGPATVGEQDAFARFCGAVAARYRGRVYAYEVWNEVNSRGFWKPEPSVASYSSLLVKAARALRAADPAAVVVSSGLAQGEGATAVFPWTEAFLTSPGAAVIDGFGFHPYSNGTGQVDGMLAAAFSLRAVLDARGFSHLPLYMTEAGASSAGRGEAAQAALLDLTARALEALEGVNCVLWYCLRDKPWEANASEATFGLFTGEGREKAAAATVRAAAARALPGGVVPLRGWCAQGGGVRRLGEGS